MTKISAYPEIAVPTTDDLLIGTDVETQNQTKNFSIQSVIDLVTLQQVVDSGNTIVVPTTVSKGIDITLANESTSFQNGISVTIPAQTGIYPTYQPAPDAFVANINGQTPGTLIGSVVGFLASAANDDNVGFFADLTATSGTSRGFETNSFDAHTGDYFRARKYTLGVDSIVFKVANNGDTTANSLTLFDDPQGGYSKIGVSDNYFYVTNADSSVRLLEIGNNLLTVTNGNGGIATIINNLTTSRSYLLPNNSGTFALTSNLASYVPYTGATNNVNLGEFDLFTDNISTSTGDVLTLSVGNTGIRIDDAGSTVFVDAADFVAAGSVNTPLVNATQYRINALNTAPATTTSTGTLGEIRYTSGFIYVCIATNTWRRTALTTW